MSGDPPFKICIHFDGTFDAHTGRYTGGETCDLPIWDIDKLCYWDIIEKLQELGHGSFKSLYYKISNLSLVESMVHGLHSLKGDAEIIEVAKILIQSTVCHVFVEHCPVAVDEYLGVRSLWFSSENSARTTMVFEGEDALGSDADDEELLAGINKHAGRISVNEGLSNLHGMQRKDKGKQKVVEEKHKMKNKFVESMSSSKGIRIREPNNGDENGPRIVENSDFEDDETDSLCNSSTYIHSSDPGSYYSDSSIDNLNVKDDALRRPSKSLHYDPTSDSPHFEVGMVFENAVQFKAAIAKYSIKKGCKLWWKKNEPGRQRIACDVKNGCTWEIFASFDNSDDTFKVKTYRRKHSCFKSNKNKMATESFLVDALRMLVTNSPHMSSRQLAEHVKEELKVEVSKYKCQKAKRIIKNELEGCYIEQYKLLRGYGEHMLATNPGSTCVIGTDTNGAALYQFKRMYMCFDGCKRGWKAGCRRIIGVDGCFLKGVCKGILLTAVGRDGNNQMFPLAWAIVDTENKENWEWFMELLKIDIDCGDGAGLTIISDMHKGIITARDLVFPIARHRYCARHIYANWAKIYKGEEYKKRFWAIARATWEGEFVYQVNELKKISEQAWTDLAKIPPKYWCKAFLDEATCCDAVDNNMCESFNFWIMEARYKAIINSVDTIREQLMERIAEKMSSSHKWKGDIAPRVKTKLGKNKNESSECRLLWDGTAGFEVKHKNDRHAVDLQKRTCTCRAWQLNGIPCPHAICCMFHENLDPEDFVVDWYRKGKYQQSYNFPIKAMCGDKCWQKFHGDPVNPPPIKTRPGRPKKNRRKAKDEPKKMSKSKMSRRGRIMTCSYCKQEGHNKAGCPFVTTNETPPAVASSSQIRKRHPSAAYHRKKQTGKAQKTQKTRTNVGPSTITLNISQSSIVNSDNSTPTTNPRMPTALRTRSETSAVASMVSHQLVNSTVVSTNAILATTSSAAPSTDSRNIFVVPPSGDDMNLSNEDNFWTAF